MMSPVLNTEELVLVVDVRNIAVQYQQTGFFRTPSLGNRVVSLVGESQPILLFVQPFGDTAQHASLSSASTGTYLNSTNQRYPYFPFR